MLDKTTIRELIENNCRWGEYDGEMFYIVDGWSFIRQVNKYQGIDFDDTRVCSHCHQNLHTPGCGSGQLGGHYSPYKTPTDVLDFDHILSFINSPYPFPVYQDDIDKFRSSLETLESIENGQMTFIEWEWPYEFSPEIVRELLVVYQEHIDDDPIYWVNDYITDEIDSVEWGFSDEYDTCSNCGNVIRTSPDSYGWTPKYYDTEYGDRLCSDCSQDCIEDAIQEIQSRIDNGDTPKSLPFIFDLTDEWMEVSHPVYSNSRWENGLHPGQNDSPDKQGQIVRSVKVNGRSIFEIVFRVYPSQFTIEWETFIRINPDYNQELIDNNKTLPDETGMGIEEWINIFSDKFASQDGRTKYDLATLMSEGLQRASKSGTRFNSIVVDSESGDIDITGTNNIDEYFE